MRPKTSNLLGFLAAILLHNPTQGAIHRVYELVNGSDGLSWQTAIRTPGKALASASDEDEQMFSH